MQRILVATLALLVTRDAMTTLPVTVAAHELPIQRAVFGRDNVEVRENEKTVPVALTPDLEHERLAGRYGEQALEKAYGANFVDAITDACLKHKVGDAPDDVDTGLGGFDATGEGKVVVPDSGSALEAMTKPQLLEHARVNGIEGVTRDMNKADILAAIEAAAETA